MSRYNFRKRESKQWKSDYERVVNGAGNIFTVEYVRKQILETFENIEQTKISLLCPLTKQRIVVPVRYRNCRHLQCFDLEGFLAMISKCNFLVCPICKTKVKNEIECLRVDKFFQKILTEFSSSTEAVILGDGTFKATFSHSALIVPKVIDDEEPYEPEHSATLKCEVKSEVDSNAGDVEELNLDSSFDNKASESNAETQDTLISDASMECDISQAVDCSTNIDETETEANHRWDSKASSVPPPGRCNPQLANQSNTQAMFSTSMAFPASSTAGMGMPTPLIYPGMMTASRTVFSMPPLRFSHVFPGVNTKISVGVSQNSDSRNSTNQNVHIEQVESAKSPTRDESQLDGLEALAELSRLTRKMGGEEDEDVDLRKLYTDHSRRNNIWDNSSEAMKEYDEGNVSIRDANSAINEIYRLTQMFSNE